MSGSRLLAVATAVVLIASQARTASQVESVTSPFDAFGAHVGADYFLATYPQLEAYWQALDAQSERMRLVDIGRTEEGRSQWMAVISSPDNLSNLDRYRDLSRRLALAEGLTDEQARALAREGRAIVWIDGGQHATEVLGAQQLIELVYQLVSATDEDTQRVLRDVIVLVAHANPDGHALVADWYMRERQPRRRTLDGLPRLYQKYAGHDNNRDFYLSSQAETVNINRVLYREWFPQVVYTHHQAPPPGTVMFAPPFRGPFSALVDPLIAAGVDRMGAAMHARFAAEGKPGVTMRGGGEYSSWWNGSLRTSAYFHNQIGLLTETIGDPAPGAIARVASRQVASADLPMPIAPQPWRFRQSIEYSMTANRAVLDAASRDRETLLYDVYRMGRRAIESLEGPRAYILPADQPDFPTATKFVDALLKSGVAVHRATAKFEAAGRSYGAGSYVVKTTQAFRAHVLDMFEPQHPPVDETDAPYDISGWTLAFQMGVTFDRLTQPVDGPFEVVSVAPPASARITGIPNPRGFLLSHRQNDAAIAVNRLLDAGDDVYWLPGTGAIYVPAERRAPALLENAAAELGVSVTGTGVRPAGGAMRLRRPRVALWEPLGGAATSGWTRWLLERYEFSFDTVDTRAIDAGRLAGGYDVVVLTDEAVPGAGGISQTRTIPRLRDFVERGGTLMLIGDSTAIAQPLGVPVTALARDRYFVPGAVMRVSVDHTSPLAYGFEPEVDVFFAHSPVFALPAAAAAGTPRRVAWFSSAAPLRSGVARGQQSLEGAAAVVDAPLGRGRVLLFGPEIVFRAQPHGTFKFLFNGIHYSAATSVQ